MILLYPFYYLIFTYNGIYNISPYYTNPFKINLAQYYDAAHYIKIIEKCVNENPNKKIILYGCSKGASTIISVLYHMTEEQRKKVNLIILEGVFDDVNVVLKYRFGKFSNIVKYILSRITCYNDKYITPINMIKNINVDIPVMIISSLKDKIVPYTSSLNIYNEFKKYSDKIHLISLKNSSHSNYVGDDIDDINLYYNNMYEFYKSYLI